MPKKKVEFPNEEEYEEVWDFRKVAIGVVILILLFVAGFIAKRIIMGESLDPATFIPKIPSVKGIFISTVPGDQTTSHMPISLPSQKDVTQKVQEIRQQVANLNIAEIASSSPQVQQVLKQLQQLPSYPADQAKQACMRVCNQL